MNNPVSSHPRRQSIRSDQEICGECAGLSPEPDSTGENRDAPSSSYVEDAEAHMGAGPVADALSSVFHVLFRDLIADVAEQSGQDFLNEVRDGALPGVMVGIEVVYLCCDYERHV